MRNKYVGLIIVGVSLLIGLIVWLFNAALNTIVSESCSHGPTCPMWGTIRFQTNVGLGIMLLVSLIGLYIIFFTKDNTEPKLVKEVHKEVKIIKEQFKPKKFDKGNYSKILSDLEKDEQAVLNVILDNGGNLFQSKIVEYTGQSKVRVTRILDKLESKDIIERKRRGMTNIVFLKNK
ncbi:MAG TPA: MarR family transcriptional regulator [Allocoleopsis sp.]